MALTWTTTPQDISDILHCHFFNQHDRQPGFGPGGTPKEIATINFQSTLLCDLITKDHDRTIRRELARMQNDGQDYDEQAAKAMHLIEAVLQQAGKLPRSCLFYDPERIDKLLEREDLEDFDFLQEEPPS